MDPTQNWLFHLCRITPEEIRLIQLSRGQVITDRLDGERQVALVCSGRVKVLAENANGGQLLVNQVGEGALFGVSNLLLEEELATSIQAQRQSLLAMVSKPLVIQRLRENPQAMERYARFLNGRIQFLLGRIRSLTPAPAQLKLASWLQTGQKDGRIKLPSKVMLAKALGMSRATLFRELATLEERKLLVPVSEKPRTYSVDTTGLQHFMEEQR